MSLDIEYEKTYEKIEDICMDNNLAFSFENSKFPIVAKITPSFEVKNQMRMETGEDSNYISGEIQLVFGEVLNMKILNDFYIEDKLLNRIKNQAKNLHYIYLQQYFKKMMDWDKVITNKEETNND